MWNFCKTKKRGEEEVKHIHKTQNINIVAKQNPCKFGASDPVNIISDGKQPERGGWPLLEEENRSK